MQRILGIFIVLIIGVVSIAAQTSAEMELHGGSGGLQCSMCGSECKVLCASRQSRLFRSCCLNFMRKRSDPEFEDFLYGGGSSKFL